MDETKRQELVKAYELHLTTKAKVESFRAERPFGRSNVAEYHAAVEAAHQAWVALVEKFGFPERDFPVYFHVKHIHDNWACKGIKHYSQNRSREYVTIEATGMTTEQLVDAYREHVCTHCFPSAPVAQFRAEAAQRKQEERAAAKAERDAKKAEKAITMPDGSPLRDIHGGKINSLVTAERELVDAIMTTEFVEQLYPMPNRAFFGEYLRYIDRALKAISAKTGSPSGDIYAAARTKAQAKFKREYK